MPAPFEAILHPTDFSDSSMDAFVHALKIALKGKSRLHVLHVASRSDELPGAVPPQIRRTLAAWGLMDQDEPPSTVAERFGIKVDKIELAPENPVSAILGFLDQHPCNLIVLATHGREGVPRWLHGSVAETVARRAATDVLFVPPDASGFVDQATGHIRLRRILVPIDHVPDPGAALPDVEDFARLAEDHAAEIRLFHVGNAAPILSRKPDSILPGTIVTRSGDVVATILNEATEWKADLIAMPTAGHNGLMDALRGSTTERVLRHAPCPVLAVPVNR
ncbi:MAG: universal stress protein [Rhizomicrobium sp.]